MQEGFALAISLILLVVLTLIAVTVIRATGLGARMTANNAIANEALETSESARGLAELMVEGNAYYRGWPCSMVTGSATCGGSPPIYAVVDADWDTKYSVPTGMTILRSNELTCPSAGTSTSAFKNWFASNSEQDSTRSTPYGTGYTFDPVTSRTASTPATLDYDACFSRTISGFSVTGNISVYKLRADIAPGSGGAMVSGYEGTGRGSAGSGGYIYFHTQTDGQDASNLAQSQTASVYRHLIRN